MGLKRDLTLLDATSIGIGAIIGAGIFAVIGIAVGYAGPAVVISMIIAGIAASFTAFSFAELGSAIPKEGGAYQFAYELISPSVGFVIGCLWLFAQIVAGAAISISFASYFVAIFPILPSKIVAVITALTLTGLNLIGIKQSTTVNNILVAVKIAILCLFVAFGVFHINPQNFADFNPNGAAGILQGASFIFFAYLGYGRIAALGEEVKNPEKNLPRAILISLIVAIAVYVLTGFAATGMQDYRILAQSAAPIADAIKPTGNFTMLTLVSAGALIATISVLLTSLIGLSRVAFAMARNGQFPKSIAKVSAKFGTPYLSVLTMGLLLTVLAFALELKETVAITSFALLATHLVVNLCAIKLRKSSCTTKFRTPCYPANAMLGSISCLILMFSLPAESWIVGAVVVAISAALYLLNTKKQGKSERRLTLQAKDYK
ncbi:MAG: amino acid permease [Candidatus Bathyarchaeota archaeon]|nr:amino acid permease [Candidatus Bathyarchaeota archaeon]